MVEAYIKITTCAKCKHRFEEISEEFEFIDDVTGQPFGELYDWSCKLMGYKNIVIGVADFEEDVPIPYWCPLTKEKILQRNLNSKLKKIKNEKRC